MIIWLLLYAQLVLADGPVVEEYCFSSVSQMNSVYNRTKFILIPNDKVQLDKNCLSVNTSEHRRELIQSYIKRLDPAAKIAFSSAEIKRDPCRIKVEKEKSGNTNHVSGNVDLVLTPSAAGSQSTHTASETMSIQTLKAFELTVNQDTIKGECNAISADRYDIKLFVIKAAKPLLPPVPANTIVIIPDSQIPPVQDTSSLQTELQLRRGQRIEIGSIVRNLQEDHKRADEKSGVDLKLSVGANLEKVFLTID